MGSLWTMSDSLREQLEEYRAQIDKLDIEFIDVLSRRLDVVRAVGRLKAGSDISVVQPERAQAVKDRAAQMGEEKGLSPEFVRRLYDLMIAHAHELEHDLQDAG